MSSFIHSLQTRKDLGALYQEKLDELPVPYEMLQLETSFGNTNIILTGRQHLPPLVLLHGLNGCAPMVLGAWIELAKCYRIYAIDRIGRPGLGTEIDPETKSNAYGQWMFEILTWLNVREATLVGVAFGGFISWKTLVFDKRRIARVCLITPAGIVTGNYWRIWWKIWLPLKLFLQHGKPKYVHRVADALLTESDPLAIRYLKELTLHDPRDLYPAPLITRGEAARIRVPVYLVAADGDLLFPGRKMLQWAKVLFPSLQQAVLLKNSKHVPGRTGNQQITRLLRDLAR